MTCIVFLGATLDHASARALIDAEIRPPAAQGDVFRACRDGARCIGLIDGLFQHVASVWHREILFALSQGVHVFGASSMGALRAAELDTFGMHGVGVIYQAYRDGTLEDDDEVAVVHAPAAAGGGALSDAMVDLRATIQAAARAGVVTAVRATELIADMKALHFPERHISRLARSDAGLAAWLPGNEVRLKAADAAEMLRAMAAFVASRPGPHVANFRFEPAQVWTQFAAGVEATDITPEAARVLDTLRLDPAAWRSALQAVLGRQPSPPAAPEAARRHQLDRLRQAHGLWQRADLQAWIAANGLDARGLDRLLDAEAALDAAAEAVRSGPPHRALDRRLVDHLRATGAYARLLGQAKVEPVIADRHHAGPAALEWYFGRLGMDVPRDLDGWTASAGWANRKAFDSALARAYRSSMIAKTP